MVISPSLAPDERPASQRTPISRAEPQLSKMPRVVAWISIENPLTRLLGPGGYQILGVACFGAMATTLWNVARQRTKAK